MKLRHKFAHVEAFQFTKAMADKKDPVPFGVNVVWLNWNERMPDKEVDIRPMVQHSANSHSVAEIGSWILIDLQTKETMVYYEKEFMMSDYVEEK